MTTRIAFVLAAIVLAPMLVAAQNQPSSAQNPHNTHQTNPAAPIYVNCNCATQADDGKNKPQGWHKLITWPEGIATWALIATLGAIVYQAIVTHLSVKVARDALIATRRPTLMVKHISLIPGRVVEENGKKTIQDDFEWRINCVLANVGASGAHITQSDLTISRLGIGTLDGLLPPVPPYKGKYSFGTFAMEPGERCEKIVALERNSDTMNLRVSHHAAENRGRAIETTPIVCFGFFRYLDESGVPRLTGFGWSWNAYDMSFTRLNNSDYEYQD